MNVAQSNLPMTGANLKPSWVLAIDPLNIPVLSLAVTGEGYDRVGLRTLVGRFLRAGVDVRGRLARGRI